VPRQTWCGTFGTWGEGQNKNLIVSAKRDNIETPIGVSVCSASVGTVCHHRLGPPNHCRHFGGRQKLISSVFCTIFVPAVHYRPSLTELIHIMNHAARCFYLMQSAPATFVKRHYNLHFYSHHHHHHHHHQIA